jgi:hypothetical protein
MRVLDILLFPVYFILLGVLGVAGLTAIYFVVWYAGTIVLWVLNTIFG